MGMVRQFEERGVVRWLGSNSLVNKSVVYFGALVLGKQYHV